ncbi:Autophagy protein 7 [Ophidiomyces ophidiicola]|nr:Autophagy protein 7 [Ophidiomyces ophidiicola]KAI1930229.1 Autophagy protein 7 [Ophidiomyces ophidiicola]KAI1968160.1 Autophagy protein 7 [Ophidiomyces ophidiicola]KAI1969347.1 Autophagy protein 7 [Ophidiomyces ophidiicola]KAI2005172.1 Autophagy protein 7 [Ophidiomyces ophidiicola]
MQYTPFISDIEIPFYSSLASRKLNHDKLDDSARKLLGFYELRPSDLPQASCRMQINGNALVIDEVPTGSFRADGIIKNFNTAEDYQNSDKSALLQEAGQRIWDSIMDETVYSQPSILASFLALSFADLKKYRFSYWFAFPAIHSIPPWSLVNASEPKDSAIRIGTSSQPSLEQLTIDGRNALVTAVQNWRHKADVCQHGFFLAKRSQPTALSGNKEHGLSWVVSSLSAYETGFFQDSATEDCFVCFADPSNYRDTPGWMLRNLLILIRYKWRLNRVRIIRYRDILATNMEVQSIIVDLISESVENVSNADLTMPKVSGWERNASGKLSGRVVNLTEYMDPQRLADQSVDLNLTLMKWRISPGLDLQKIKNTKCLLLGAGTLGCYVARCLLAWGVKTITFVDNGSVSFSNPVRQPLFSFTDCLDGGVKKALRAAESLQEIYPGVSSTGHVLSIPMAGHPMVNPDQAKTDYETLKRLVDEHDAVFLLMDTRESRWLPTVMGKAAGKVVMNAALGFDTFLVMRHGDSKVEPSLGCYFCNDIVAPANSAKAQTLDQQCTVTRPGGSMMASSLLVELFISLLQQPEGVAAPTTSENGVESPNPLGIVPHQIRGYLSTFSFMNVTGRSYEFCSACSNTVLNAYRAHGWEFVQRAINESGYIEEVSGLKEVQRQAEEAIASLELEDSSFESDSDLI